MKNIILSMFSISHSLTIPGDYTNPDFEIQFYWDGNFNQQQQDPQVKINENAFFSIICTSSLKFFYVENCSIFNPEMSRQIELIKNRCGEASLNVEDLTGPSLTEQMFQFKAFKFNKIRNDKQILICEVAFCPYTASCPVFQPYCSIDITHRPQAVERFTITKQFVVSTFVRNPFLSYIVKLIEIK